MSISALIRLSIMIKQIRNLRDSYRYNKYITTTVRPLERDTVAAFLELARPVFERRAQATGLNVTWDAPVTNVLVTDYPFPKGMSEDPKVQRRYNLQSESTAGMVLRHQSDADDVQKGALNILTSPRLGLLVSFKVPAANYRYIKTVQCLDYLLQHDRENLMGAFEAGVPVLMSLKDKKAFALANGVSSAAGKAGLKGPAG
jgi:hypothetical protein